MKNTIHNHYVTCKCGAQFSDTLPACPACKVTNPEAPTLNAKEPDPSEKRMATPDEKRAVTPEDEKRAVTPEDVAPDTDPESLQPTLNGKDP